jgi:hypothetical protein
MTNEPEGFEEPEGTVESGSEFILPLRRCLASRFLGSIHTWRMSGRNPRWGWETMDRLPGVGAKETGAHQPRALGRNPRWGSCAVRDYSSEDWARCLDSCYAMGKIGVRPSSAQASSFAKASEDGPEDGLEGSREPRRTERRISKAGLSHGGFSGLSCRKWRCAQEFSTDSRLVGRWVWCNMACSSWKLEA